MSVLSSFKTCEFPGVENQGPRTLEAIRDKDCGWFFVAAQDEFARIPGSPIAYWIRNAKPFDGPRISDKFVSGGRTKTHGNEQFVRLWWEVEIENQAWAPYAMGGEFRKYSGNLLQVVNWSAHARSVYDSYGGLYPEEFWHKEGITWGKITSARVGFREKPSVAHYDSGAGAIFASDFVCDRMLLGFLNSPIVNLYLKAMNPTVNTTVNDVLALPLPAQAQFSRVDENVLECVSGCRTDWNAYERSWDFQSLPLLTASSEPTPTLESSYTAWITQNRDTIAEMKRLEEENNRLFIDSYGLADELTPDVPIEQITLTVNPAYRYGGKLTEEEQWTRFRQDTMEELVSYAIGCMMGRYSLDAPGLILADSQENPEAHMSAYCEKVGKPMDALKFQPDDDGIIPVLDDEWFEDDVVERFKVFLRAAFGNESLEENLRFLEEAIGKKIRKYFVNDFYKAHLQTYKKRPIYWLFQSPKKSFQALVYLHRYDRDTVNRLLNDYLRPYQDKLRNRQDHLDSMLASEATSNRDRNAATKEKEKNAQALTELADWERDVIYPLATQRLEIDLDDGVKQNYPKFGKALAKVPGLS
jgi:type II restriction/modification system DNA methylase subunit YeeA